VVTDYDTCVDVEFTNAASIMIGNSASCTVYSEPTCGGTATVLIEDEATLPDQGAGSAYSLICTGTSSEEFCPCEDSPGRTYGARFYAAAGFEGANTDIESVQYSQCIALAAPVDSVRIGRTNYCKSNL
jgi:hypothetical protein